MPNTSYWADDYVQKRTSAENALKHIKSGQRIFIGSSCGEPQHLVNTLSEISARFTDLEIVRLLSTESGPLTLIANKTRSQRFNIRSFYLGSGLPSKINRGKRFITPINLSQIPQLFRSRMLPLDAALIQVSPPDDFGWMSLGVSVDIAPAACEAADIVICQINQNMPRVMGKAFIHTNDVDYIVDHEEDLLTLPQPPESEEANIIAKHISRLINDGSTLQTGLGVTNDALMLGLSQKNDLGVHTQYLSNGLMRLYSLGVVNNKKKGLNNGKLVASTAVGSKLLYDFIDDNPSIEFHPSDYVNDPAIIARHNSMVSLHTIMGIDLTGQVATDALPFNKHTGINGILDFTRGASMSNGGKSIFLLTSTSDNGTKSRIIPALSDIAVVVPRGDVQYVATEYGVVNLFGKNLQERAMALISIAHPDFRDELFEIAKEMKLIEEGRKFKHAIKGVYPLKHEETIVINGTSITFRPAKPVDERGIQEHYYRLNHGDVVSRFLHDKKSFVHDQIYSTFEIDYVNELTIVATIGEVGFEKIIGMGEYYKDPESNTAEVAFSVSEDYQGMGIAGIIQRKLSRGAQDSDINGLVAYTSNENSAMKKLFYKLPYKIKTKMEGSILVMSCDFKESRELES